MFEGTDDTYVYTLAIDAVPSSRFARSASTVVALRAGWDAVS